IRWVAGDEPGLQLTTDVLGRTVVDLGVRVGLAVDRLVDLGGVGVGETAVEDVHLQRGVGGYAERVVLADLAFVATVVAIVTAPGGGTRGERSPGSEYQTCDGHLLQESTPGGASGSAGEAAGGCGTDAA